MNMCWLIEYLSPLRRNLRSLRKRYLLFNSAAFIVCVEEYLVRIYMTQLVLDKLFRVWVYLLVDDFRLLFHLSSSFVLPLHRHIAVH